MKVQIQLQVPNVRKQIRAHLHVQAQVKVQAQVQVRGQVQEQEQEQVQVVESRPWGPTLQIRDIQPRTADYQPVLQPYRTMNLPKHPSSPEAGFYSACISMCLPTESPSD